MSDAQFLPQALTLYRSLARHASSFQLRVLCLDTAAEAWFRRSDLPGVTPVPLAELEEADPELAACRSHRTWLEYCWTVTPVFCKHVVTGLPPEAVVAWIDADIELVRDPALLLDELGDGSVLLVPHRYYQMYPRAHATSVVTERYGKFNGGTVVFRIGEDGLAAATLWRERSLAWCFERTEPGLFGNQLHLDDFPELFRGARVATVPGPALGPWNAGRYRIEDSADGPLADGRPVVLYHYQSLRLGRASLGLRLVGRTTNLFRLPGLPVLGRTNVRYRLSRAERRLFWVPYARRLAAAVQELDEAFVESLAPLPPRTVVADAAYKLRRTWHRALASVRRSAGPDVRVARASTPPA